MLVKDRIQKQNYRQHHHYPFAPKLSSVASVQTENLSPLTPGTTKTEQRGELHLNIVLKNLKKNQIKYQDWND